MSVAIAAALVARGYLVAAPDKQFGVTTAGTAWFKTIGLDIASVRPTRRGLARQCLDWTERQHHLAGPLGVEFLALLCAKGWARRSATSRAAEITPKGWIALRQHLGIDRRAILDDGETAGAMAPALPKVA